MLPRFPWCEQSIVVLRSPISSEATHQVHSVHRGWCSQISSVCFNKRTIHKYPVCASPSATPTSAPFTDLHFDFYKCTVHWSPLRLLQVHRSLISTATSTSALFTNPHCCVSTVAPSCSESPFINYYSVWLCDPTMKWLSWYLLTINNLATDVNTLVEYLSAI